MKNLKMLRHDIRVNLLFRILSVNNIPRKCNRS